MLGSSAFTASAIAVNIGEHVALELKLPVAVFSMEMGASQLAMRMIGSVGKLDQTKLRTGRLGPEDWERLSSALGRLSDAPILIDETPALNAIEVRSRFHMMELRRDLIRHFGGSYRHTLVRVEDGALRIKLQRVDLFNSQASFDYVLQIWV